METSFRTDESVLETNGVDTQFISCGPPPSYDQAAAQWRSQPSHVQPVTANCSRTIGQPPPPYSNELILAVPPPAYIDVITSQPASSSASYSVDHSPPPREVPQYRSGATARFNALRFQTSENSDQHVAIAVVHPSRQPQRQVRAHAERNPLRTISQLQAMPNGYIPRPLPKPIPTFIPRPAPAPNSETDECLFTDHMTSVCVLAVLTLIFTGFAGLVALILLEIARRKKYVDIRLANKLANASILISVVCMPIGMVVLAMGPLYMINTNYTSYSSDSSDSSYSYSQNVR